MSEKLADSSARRLYIFCGRGPARCTLEQRVEYQGANSLTRFGKRHLFDSEYEFEAEELGCSRGRILAEIGNDWLTEKKGTIQRHGTCERRSKGLLV
jgi:hypothetical protein